MKSHAFAALAALTLLGAAAPAAAKDYSAEAVLQTAAAAPGEVVLDGRFWRCDGETCRGTASGVPASQPAVAECRRVVKKLGPVSSYRSGARTLDAAALAACNAP